MSPDLHSALGYRRAFLRRADSAIGSLSGAIARMPARWFLASLILVQVVLHLRVLALPPMGQHTWRQVMWAAPARNYYEEDNRFFYPRHDVRLAADDPGYLYHEFPLLFWIIGQSYRVTGEQPANGRIVMLVMGSLLIVAAYGFMKALGYSERLARWFVFFLAGSPEFFYYSVTMESSLPALTWFVAGLALLIPELRRARVGWRFWLGMGLVLLATLTKQVILFFGLPVALLFVHAYVRHRQARVLWAGLAAFGVLVATHAAIYWHTMRLYAMAPLERQGYWEHGPVPLPHSMMQVMENLLPVIKTWIPEIYVNSAAVPLVLVGLWRLMRQPRSDDRMRQGFWLAWLVSLLIFCGLFWVRLGDHEYYLTELLMLTALVSAVGTEWLMTRQRWRWVAMALVALVPLVMYGRMSPRWSARKQVPDELLYRAEELQRLLPPHERVLVVGDGSPVVYLYYLHRKGISTGGDVDPDQFQRVMQNDIRWAVTSVPLAEVPVLAKQGRVRGRVGRFIVLELPRLLPT